MKFLFTNLYLVPYQPKLHLIVFRIL